MDEYVYTYLCPKVLQLVVYMQLFLYSEFLPPGRPLTLTFSKARKRLPEMNAGNYFRP